MLQNHRGFSVNVFRKAKTNESGKGDMQQSMQIALQSQAPNHFECAVVTKPFRGHNVTSVYRDRIMGPGPGAAAIGPRPRRRWGRRRRR